jgi:cell division protein FtsW
MIKNHPALPCQNTPFLGYVSPRFMNGIAVVFCVTVLALVTFGLVMLASASSVNVYQQDAFFFAKRQAMWLAFGLAACAITARVNYRWYRTYAWPLFIAAILLLIGVFIFGKPINGAMRWYVFGPIRFQPSEFAKYVLVIVLACWLEKMQRASKGQLRPKIQHWWSGVFAPLTITGGLAALILKEPDLGTTLLLFAVAMMMMWVAGAPSGWLAGILGIGGTGVAAFLVAVFWYGMFQSSYQVRRLVHWWRGDDLQGTGYQQYIAMLAFGSGGPWGDGLGNSRMKLFYLPEAHTDFIFPIIGEELGLIATLAVVAVFCVLLLCGILMASRAQDQFGLLLGWGIMAIIGLQAIINIAVVTSVFPNKGMPLPFISYGGTNLFMTLAALGVVLNIFWQARSRATLA